MLCLSEQRNKDSLLMVQPTIFLSAARLDMRRNKASSSGDRFFKLSFMASITGESGSGSGSVAAVGFQRACINKTNILKTCHPYNTKEPCSFANQIGNNQPSNKQD